MKAERSLTSRHLLHEDLDEAVLADGAQVLNDVLVLQVFVQRDLLVKRLGVAVRKGAHGEEDPLPSEGAAYRLRAPAGLLLSPAVPFGDFFDGQADLGAEISPCVHDPEGAFPQNHPLSMLIVLIVVLQRETAATSLSFLTDLHAKWRKGGGMKRDRVWDRSVLRF